jgi:uncharacterized protein
MQLIDGGLRFSASDLTAFVACHRLTWLSHEAATGRIPAPPSSNRQDGVGLSARKGLEHERRYLESLLAEGLDVVEIRTRHGLNGTSRSAADTREAMRRGADVIYQAVLVADDWLGHVDFLRRVEAESCLGPWSYEAVDTKLARHTKPSFVVQLALYSDLLAQVQGSAPDGFEIVLGSGCRERLRCRDFDSYVRRLRARFLRHLADSTEPYPEPVEHCPLCRWVTACDAQRAHDDHLSLVAGMRRDQIAKLGFHGVDTVAALGGLLEPPASLRIGDETFVRIRAQAALQTRERADGKPLYELLPPQADRGFALLPEPSEHDVFFDMEGDPYYEGHGLEYLFGAEYHDGDDWRFKSFWGRSRHEERHAFERFVDWALERWRGHPDLHIYHYAQYEPTALKRLAGQHGTREIEVDELLRHGVLVDLYAVVRHAVRISRPSYSIKEMEAFYRGHKRDTEVGEGGQSIEVFEEWLATGDQQLLDSIQEYNADDCRSTRELRDWLLDRRSEAWTAHGVEHRYTPPDPHVPTDEARAIDDETRALMERLVDGIPEDAQQRNGDEQARRLLADLIDYHRREQRAVWWRFFELCAKDHEQLLEDLEAITGLEPIGEPEVVTNRGATAQWFSFPSQEFKFGPGSVIDPETQQDAGEILDIDVARRRLQLKRTAKLIDAPLPRSVFPFTLYQDGQHRRALRDLARVVLERGFGAPGPMLAARRLLIGEAPHVRGVDSGVPLNAGELTLDAMQDIVSRLDGSPLFVQGPPGSGKTWRGARVIVDLLRRGKRVGITSNSHRAICKLLEEVDKASLECRVEVRAMKRATTADQEYHSDAQPDSFGNTKSNERCDDPELNLVAGTSWLFVREAMAQRPLDYLFIDEAGQVALANAAAVAGAATNLVLLGDPQQLAQVSQAYHPDGAGDSVLQHLLGDRSTVPPNEGLFLDHSWRMHPDVCAYISELAYDGRLLPAPGTELRRVDSCSPLAGTGLRFIPVEHEGNRQASPEEARRIGMEVGALLADAWVTNAIGERRRIESTDILVVAAYNHHVSCLREHVDDHVAVGTVDKFQGQEAPIVFYSLATSTPGDAPRGIDFLFDRNRLNVAVSRAQCIAVVVGNPALLDGDSRTVGQVRLLNGACRFVEEATRH